MAYNLFPVQRVEKTARMSLTVTLSNVVIIFGRNIPEMYNV